MTKAHEKQQTLRNIKKNYGEKTANIVACLLRRMSTDQICEKMQVTPRQVATYHSNFTRGVYDWCIPGTTPVMQMEF